LGKNQDIQDCEGGGGNQLNHGSKNVWPMEGRNAIKEGNIMKK